MPIQRDVTVKIIGDKAKLSAKLHFYERDYGILINFLLQEYKFRYDPNPKGVLSSIEDDVLTAYTTIVNPAGEELTRQNGTIVNELIRFELTEDLTEDLYEIGTYKLQFHIVCTHSEITIPPIEFEIKERLKGGSREIYKAIIGSAIIGKTYIEEE